VRRLVYGAREEKTGAVESVFRVCDNSSLNHRIELTPGVLEEECRTLMQEFFRARRQSGVRDQRSEVSEDADGSTNL
jgi:tRNA(adenine34) deaminase